MKKILASALTVVLMVSVVFSSTGCKSKQVKEWYKETLEYYRDGIKNGFDDVVSKLSVPEEMKDKNNRFGYLLRDLDGDGIDELLIGMIDDGSCTKFTNVVVRHTDLGTYSLLNSIPGYYIYLCSDNVLQVDQWYGSETKKDFMKYKSKTSTFEIIEGEGKYLPMKWDLTEF